MSYRNIGEKWIYPDANYKRKSISSYTIELLYGTKRGGQIVLWKKADSDDVENATKLPHVFDITPDHKNFMIDEINFWNWENAENEYKQIKTVKDIYRLASRNA